MLLIALGFTIGLLSGQALPVLLLLSICVCAFVALAVIRRRYITYMLLLLVPLCVAVLWVQVHAHFRQKWTLPTSLISRNVQIEGVIVSIPASGALGKSFLFKMHRLAGSAHQALLRLNWIDRKIPSLRIGQAWRMTVRLKPPHGLHNPGGFDFKQWLVQQGIRATGYVRAQPRPLLLRTTACCVVGRWRQFIQDQIKHAGKDSVLNAILSALTVGSRADLSQQAWRIFQRTGTSHLIAISGLHVGMIAALFYWLCMQAWRLTVWGMRRVPAQVVGGIGSVVAAILYGLMAGYSLPTQRAVIMIVAVVLGLLCSRRILLWQRLLLAYLLVLVLQPFAIFSASFWLSFMAVGIIAYGFSGRIDTIRGWRSWLKIQLAIFIGLLPVTLFFFQQISLVMVLSNLVAIPWISMLIVPLCLLSVLLLCINASMGAFAFYVAGICLQPLWWVLQWFSALPHAVWIHPLYQPWLLPIAIVGVLLLLAPRGWPGRWLGSLWLLPLFFYRPAVPAAGHVWLTVLDVGQGLATVVQTQHHTLVYDTGPRFAGSFDAGARVVVPYLHWRGVSHVDLLMVSHGDNDHIGGAKAVLAVENVVAISSSVPQRFRPHSALACWRGQQWRWDGVQFNVLYPVKNSKASSNNRSCVLRVTAGSQHLLLTGDIEKPAEQWLLRYARRDLAADVLVVPHHGSKTSSTPAFVQAVAPHIAVIGAGFYNRFHFPSPRVVARYQQVGAQVINTADVGAVVLKR